MIVVVDTHFRISHVIQGEQRANYGDYQNQLRCLPTICVGDLITGTAFPDGLALGLQGLELISQLEPVMLTSRTHVARDDFLRL